MKKQKILTIICPVFNAEKTLERLMKSLISDYKDEYDVFFIDDGSTDDSLKILKEYEQKYDFIEVFNKKNTGVSDTRNFGLKCVNTKYVTFIDSDDCYTKDYFEKIIPLIRKNDFELFCFKMNLIVNGVYENNNYNNSFENIQSTGQQHLISYLNGKYCYKIGNGPCNKIYLTNIIDENSIVFDKKKSRGEDLLFNMEYISKISKYTTLNYALYNYYVTVKNVFEGVVYEKNNVEEMVNYYLPIKKICEDVSLENMDRYIGLFFLRRIPGVVLNEVKNPDYCDGKNKIKSFLKSSNINKVLKCVKIKDLDFKLLICFVLYKFKMYIFIYKIFYLLRKIKKR